MQRVDGWRQMCGLLLLASACGRQAGERDAAASPRERENSLPGGSTASSDGRGAAGSSRGESATGFTVGSVEWEPAPQGIALLTDVRYGVHEGFDRLVFEFAGDQLPGYHVEYIDKPVRQCGSGEATRIAGDAWLEVRLSPANAHTPSGAPTIAFREKKLDLGVVKELEQTCDFEAHVTWVLGATRPNPYRVLTLEAPVRLVVDVQR